MTEPVHIDRPTVVPCQVHVPHPDGLDYIHRYLTVQVDLRGPSPVPDWPTLDAGVEFPFRVFEPKTVDGYCPADDEVSRSILMHGRWEMFETALWLDVLDKADDGLVLDFGCHVGWYSVLALLCGHDVMGWDESPEKMRLYARNTQKAADLMGGVVVPCLGRIEGPGVYPQTYGRPVRAVKIDLEGADTIALQMCSLLFNRGEIDHVLMEVSPMFGHDWPMIARSMEGVGMLPFRVPDKGCPDMEAFAHAPLDWLHHNGREQLAPPADVQWSVWFTRADLVR